MTRAIIPSRDAGYFATLYAANPDPWNFSASAYEHRRYQATMAALEDIVVGNAFEIGCSIGILTGILAPRCTSLFAVDIVESALAAAKLHCAGMPHVTFANRHVPEQWPVGQKFDLILISEVLYFLTPTDIARVAAQVVTSLSPNGTVLLVNYTEPVDEPSNGDQAADIFIAASHAALRVSLQQRHPKFRIDRLQQYSNSK